MNPPDGTVLERVLATPLPDKAPGQLPGRLPRHRDPLVRDRADRRGDGAAARRAASGAGHDPRRRRCDRRRAGARARRSTLEDRVELSGAFVPNEQALSAVRRADCGVVPNLPSKLNELTLSGKLLDYALLGVPAIVARLPVQAAHFDETEVTFFDPGDAASLAEAIRWVAAHPRGGAREGAASPGARPGLFVADSARRLPAAAGRADWCRPAPPRGGGGHGVEHDRPDHRGRQRARPGVHPRPAQLRTSWPCA